MNLHDEYVVWGTRRFPFPTVRSMPMLLARHGHATQRCVVTAFFGCLSTLAVASCRFSTGTGEKELTSVLLGLPPLSGFMPMNPDCGC